MFPTTNVVAYIMRLALFCFLSCAFPMINHFLRSMTLQLVFKNKEVGKKTFIAVTIGLLTIPTLVCMFYPQIASILGIIGSVAGLFIVYILPVITYLKKIKTECENPILAKAIEKN